MPCTPWSFRNDVFAQGPQLDVSAEAAIVDAGAEEPDSRLGAEALLGRGSNGPGLRWGQTHGRSDSLCSGEARGAVGPGSRRSCKIFML